MKPIIFSGPMVRAILDGRKTQTRRLVRGRTALEWLKPGMFAPAFVADPANGISPYGYAGDRLYVRECFHKTSSGIVVYRADYPQGAELSGLENIPNEDEVRWQPSIFMPRKHARIWLELEAIRIERLQEITEADAIAEGVYDRFEMDAADFIAGRGKVESTYRIGFKHTWQELNRERAPWDDNPWVWVLTFKRSYPMSLAA